MVSVTEEQLNAAIDIAADKLERSLRSLKNKGVASAIQLKRKR